VIRALLLFLLVVFLIRAVWRLLGGIVSGAISAGPVTRGGQPAAPTAVKMERDPVCGTYVVPSKAIALAKGRETLYFCSERCRDEWVHAH
jgi:YHS domain-containing protein